MPSIWDSVDTFRDISVIFHDALVKVKKKIAGGNLAASYAIADTVGTDNHRNVLLDLPGTIQLADFRIRGRNFRRDSYAFTDESGITFNLNLVMASQDFYTDEELDFDSVDAALQHLDGLSYSAVFQETMEHELAHLKNHCQKMNDPDVMIPTQEGSPLYGESGFSVQRAIRHDHTNNRTEARILEVSSACFARNWRAPVGLVYGLLEIDGGAIDVRKDQQQRQPLGLDDLREHMGYGRVQGRGDTAGGDVAGLAQAGAESVESGVAQGSKKRDRDEDGADSAGRSGGRYYLRRSRSSSPCSDGVISRTVRENNPAASARRSIIFKKDVESGSKEVESGSADEEERLHQLFVELREAGAIGNLGKGAQNTTLQVVFCDKNGQMRESFSPKEEVYVQLTFTNPTGEDAFVVLHQENFGRGAISFSLHGQDGRYCITSPRDAYVVAQISPGNSHTFRQRKLCDPYTETRHHPPNPEMVPFWTPAEPGTYNLTVNRWKVSFQLCIHSK